MPRGKKKKTPAEKFKEMKAQQPAPIVETNDEDMSESEADALIDDNKQVKKEVVENALAEVDRQQWTRFDPVVPEDLKYVVWVAVFKCPSGHKTKATNRQAKSGILCFECNAAGKEVKAEIMPQFLKTPPVQDEDMESRKKAKRGTL